MFDNETSISVYNAGDKFKFNVDAKAKEWEGLMIRFCGSKYAWKRSKDLLKVKTIPGT